MKRREFITLLGGAAIAWPLAAQAQQPERMRRIGVLISIAESDPDAQAQVAALREGLQELGWIDGRNFRIDVRWGAGDLDRIRTFARELVGLQPDVLVGRSTPVIRAFLEETRTIPIVFVVVSDPVGDSFVTSLPRPGGNVTGFTNVESSLGSKWLQILKEIAPRVARVAVISNPMTGPAGGSYYLRMVEAAAPSFAVEVIAALVHGPAEIERAIDAFARRPNGGLLVPPDVTTIKNRELIVELAARYRLPTIYPYRFIAAEGGLISYGIDLVDLYRRAAPYVDRILRGEKPADLPVQAPTKFELAINLKTAKTLGLTIPPSLLATADEVIE